MTDDGLPRDRLIQPTTVKWFWAIMGPCLVFGIVRYHVAGDVVWAHFPLFILNKVTALGAVVFTACSYLIGKVIHIHDDDKPMRLVVIKFCGLMGFFLAAMHAVMSMMLMNPAYFAKYFDDDAKMNLWGELGMTVGVFGLFFLLSPAVTTLPMMPKALGGKRWKRTQRMGYLALLLVVAHLVVLGYRGWLTPDHWPAMIPPISMVAVVAALTPLLMKNRQIRERRQEGSAE